MASFFLGHKLYAIGRLAACQLMHCYSLCVNFVKSNGSSLNKAGGEAI